jgi:hypothetical protein
MGGGGPRTASGGLGSGEVRLWGGVGGETDGECVWAERRGGLDEGSLIGIKDSRPPDHFSGAGLDRLWSRVGADVKERAGETPSPQVFSPALSLTLPHPPTLPSHFHPLAREDGGVRRVGTVDVTNATLERVKVHDLRQALTAMPARESRLS